MFYVLFMCKCVLPPGVNPTAVDKYEYQYQFYVQYSVHHGSIYQEITNRCHVTVLYFLLILYIINFNFIDLLMMDTECVRNM
jgi:hypothetical protein